MKISNKIKCAITGAAAGTANGLLGAGGGMIIIPLLVRWVKLDDRKAYASSLCIVLPMCIISSLIYFYCCKISIIQAAPYLIGGLIGGFAGGLLYKKMSMNLLRKALGLIIIYGGFRALMG